MIRLLGKVADQRTDGEFTFSVVIVDNDGNESAKDAVDLFRARHTLAVEYYVEPERNIALARNKAVENARGELFAFIDDDEFPNEEWLITLYHALRRFQIDGVLGPVLPYYETTPPEWITKGKFHERKSHKTGTLLSWTNTRTGNAMLRGDIFQDRNNLFRPEFRSGGEDRDLFRRLISQGRQFVWCAEAPVFEVVPPERWKRIFMLKRALLRGKTPYNHRFSSYLTSIIAIPLYSISLPFLLLAGHHVFMKYLISYFDHIGRVLSLFGVTVIKEKYVTK
jgi:succinoglycan biosynthesis protein ExoM